MSSFAPLRIRHIALIVLIGINCYIWVLILHPAPPRLSVSVLDVGQGDAILIEGPTGIDVLVDGGPDRSVLRRLPSVIGLFDRSIDLVVETHPDKDHIAGLAGVFDRYRVSYFMSPGIPNDTSSTQALLHAVSTEPGMQEFVARRGMRIHIGGGAYADVLYPDRDVSGIETNTGSVVMRVVYGDTSFMLTGDIPSTVEDYLVGLDGEALSSTVLKAAHHGSKSSTDALWLAAVDPQVVAISAGKDNSYGHPSPDTLERIRAEGAQVFSTIDGGTLRFVSDGISVKLR